MSVLGSITSTHVKKLGKFKKKKKKCILNNTTCLLLLLFFLFTCKVICENKVCLIVC